MRARFIGDPLEREGVLPPSRLPSEDWFDVPEGMESRYRNNTHFETDETPAASTRRSRAKTPPVEEPPADTDDAAE